MTTPRYGEVLPTPFEYTTDARFTHRLARVIVWVTVTRSLFLGVAVALVAIGLMGLLGTMLGLALTLGRGYWHDITPMLLALVITAALLAMMFGLGYYSARHSLDRQYPVGTVLAAGLGETRLALNVPGTVGEFDYADYRSVHRVGGFLYLPARVGYRRTLLPVELFPAQALGELKAKVAAG